MNIKKRNSIRITFLLLIAFTGIFIFSGMIIAEGETSYCCERTTDGAWCQNAPQDQCDTSNGLRSTPTSCESTSYCSLGTCINVQEGLCAENTPERVCSDEGGVWDERESDEIPQCQLGCCYVGDNAAFVTQTRCERLSSVYELETNFRTDITSEEQCIASVTPNVEGACVFEEDFRRTCKLLTKGECLDLELTSSAKTNLEFHEGLLCSAETLATECGPTSQTVCVEDRDEVYFVDSCGNLANIYDATKEKDQNYWREIKEKSDTCNPLSSNADSASCGNCDYFRGSTCKAYERGLDQVRPALGDSICRDLSCVYEGVEYSHGEAWCATAADDPITNSPGGRHTRLLCYNGDVTVEQCADFRQEVCLESEISNGFSVASCRANLWRDCVGQDNQRDCQNIDQRDCEWIPGDLTLVQIDDDEEQGACVPKYTPGLQTHLSDSGSQDRAEQAEKICEIGIKKCIVKFEKKLLGSWSCKENCECLEEEWGVDVNNICIALGDCGIQDNYLGYEGFNNDSLVDLDSEPDE